MSVIVAFKRECILYLLVIAKEGQFSWNERNRECVIYNNQ